MIGLLLLALALASCGGEESAPVPGPRLAFAQRAHDFGAVEQGATTSHSFAFRNEGGRALRFAGLRSGCACAATVSPGEVVAPGQLGSIEVSCGTEGLVGKERRTVTIYSNDASQPAVTLELLAEVQADVAARRPAFYFGRARAGERLRRDIRLQLSRPEMIPRSARSEGGLLAASLERRPDGEWRVALTVSPEARAGVVEDRIVVETASARQPRIVVPVRGRVVEGSSEP